MTNTTSTDSGGPATNVTSPVDLAFSLLLNGTVFASNSSYTCTSNIIVHCPRPFCYASILNSTAYVKDQSNPSIAIIQDLGGLASTALNANWSIEYQVPSVLQGQDIVIWIQRNITPGDNVWSVDGEGKDYISLFTPSEKILPANADFCVKVNNTSSDLKKDVIGFLVIFALAVIVLLGCYGSRSSLDMWRRRRRRMVMGRQGEGSLGSVPLIPTATVSSPQPARTRRPRTASNATTALPLYDAAPPAYEEPSAARPSFASDSTGGSQNGDPPGMDPPLVTERAEQNSRTMEEHASLV